MTYHTGLGDDTKMVLLQQAKAAAIAKRDAALQQGAGGSTDTTGSKGVSPILIVAVLGAVGLAVLKAKK